MGTYDLKRLEIAIQYVRRMSEGRNPVTNRPAPDNEVLTNVNVHRCLKFMDEVLTDVQKSGGTVGLIPAREKSRKSSVSETFPYEILQQYQYLQDQQVSYFLKQLEEYLPEGQKMPVAATTITGWLRENGYLQKQVVNDTGKEVSVPTRKGEDLGMYAEKGGIYPNEYYRVFYNENAQRFIISNFRKILTESEAIRERNRREKKSEGSPRSARQSGGFERGGTGFERSGAGTRRQGGGGYGRGGDAGSGLGRGGAGDAGRNSEAGGRGSGGYDRSGTDTDYSRGDARRNAHSGRRNSPAAPQNSDPSMPVPDFIPEPMQSEDLPKEYYDMLSEGWAPSDDDVPW